MTDAQQRAPPGAAKKEAVGDVKETVEQFKDAPATRRKESEQLSKQAETAPDVKETTEEATKEGDKPVAELQEGLKEGEKPPEGLTKVEPEPLTEEEKSRLTPGKDVDISQLTEQDIPKEGEEALKEGEELPKDSEATAEGLQEGKQVPKQGEEALKEGEGEIGKEGKDTLQKGEEVPKEGEGLLEEGDEKGKQALNEGDEVPKEGEEAVKEGEEAVPTEELPDLSILKGGKVNKAGNVVNKDDEIVGRIKEGVIARLVGRRVDENGDIWDDSGKKIGVAELIPEEEREAMLKEPAPFEPFPDAVVDGEGYVIFNGERVGKVVEGDIKLLRGMKVDQEGDILNRGGNVVGRAERWEPEPEPELPPEPEVDRSILAGKRVNKVGNVVDNSGTIYGRVIEGDPKSMAGRMCDKLGNILSESGDIIGKAEVVPEGERAGLKEGPFAELSGCTVSKDGKVVTPGGDVVGRLISGDPKSLFGRSVDEDGDICDKNGNVLGKAERWEEEVVEKKKNPMSGRRVNREGNVVDEDGNIVGKLTTGELSICAGQDIDDDGDVVDTKGTTIGHVSLIQDIPEPKESPEDKETREQAEKDKKLAQQMAFCLTQVVDKIKPICEMITRKIDAAERTPKEELDEEELVRQVRPLIEEGGKILTEANGIIRGLDPDGRIQANAKHKSATREATPEEFHLAEILKELTGTVAQTIENAKKKIEGMPHAKKELSPLWGLLSEPLFQILAGVGLLLSGVLGIVGKLLSGLGLGGIVDGLLGGLGIKPVLEALGIGSLTGKKGKSKGLLGLVG